MTTMAATWDEEVARRRIARAGERGSASLWLEDLGLIEVPAEVRHLKHLRSLNPRRNQIRETTTGSKKHRSR